MEREKLKNARRSAHWSLEEAATVIGVSRSTLQRWEKGETVPQPKWLRQLCEVYGKRASELDLEECYEVEKEPQANKEDIPFLTNDLTMQLMALAFTPVRSYQDLQAIQAGVRRTLEDFDMNEHMSRREALEALWRIATLPTITLGLATSGQTLCRPTEDILAHCAAAISACWELSKGEDIQFASKQIGRYLPMLTDITRGTTPYRLQASGLVAQCHLFKTVLGWHTEGLDSALSHGQQALLYSQEAADLALQITTHTQLSWIYYYAKQHERSLEEIERAAFLLSQGKSKPLPKYMHSSVYSTLAIRQALYQQPQDALSSLRMAHEHFFSSGDGELCSYVDYSHSSLVLEDGMTHTQLGLHDKALDSFAQMIDPNDFSPKVPMAARVHVEILNNQTMALLKSPKKDMERAITVWSAAIEGAKALHSEQRYHEAVASYDTMEAIWSGEKRIKELRDLILH